MTLLETTEVETNFLIHSVFNLKGGSSQSVLAKKNDIHTYEKFTENVESGKQMII
jgi:hypothetical protein